MAISTLPPALVVGDIGLVRSLGEAGIPIFVCSHYDDSVAFHSRYCTRPVHVSRTSSDEFARDLIALGKSERQKMVFFSDDDRAVLTLSEHRSELSEYYHFNLPEHATVKAILDKRAFATLARSLDIPAPTMFTPASLEELLAVVGDIPFPCVIKPANKHDWWHPKFHELVGPYQKAIRCDSKDELVDVYKKVVQINNELIVQEYVAGNDAYLYSINMYFNSRKELLAYFIGHKIRIYPIHAGVATLAETIDDAHIRDLAIDIAGKLNTIGHINIQFKQDPVTKALKVLEIHARNSTWCHLSTRAGRNITAIAYYDMIGMKSPLTNNYKTGVKWLDISRDMKAFFAYRRAGELTFWSWLSSLRGDVVHHLWSWRDPKPALFQMGFIVLRRLRRSVVQGAAPRN